jgi:hypothetical protein
VPTVVVATAHRPQSTQGLRMTLDDDSLDISVGRTLVGSTAWPASCPLRMSVSEGELRMLGRRVPLRTQTPESMPVVTGLFTDLDLRQGAAPRAVVQTKAYATSWTNRQMVAGFLAMLLACAALISLGRARLLGFPERLANRVRSTWGARDATDAVVVGALVGWWIVAPTFYDDGWLWVIERVFGDLGASSLYYDNWGVNQPLGYWLDWIRHWMVGSTNDLVFMRLPALVALAATWLVCRWCARIVVGTHTPRGTRWVLAAGFLLAAAAWGMTLRVEPFVALLAAVCLTAMASFMREPRSGQIAVAIPCVVLAATAHPAGIVAASPLLAATPAIARWLATSPRSRSVALGGALLGGLALLLVTYTLDADVGTRMRDARLLGGGEYFHAPWREYIRYVEFGANGAETAARRLDLAFLLLAILAWLTAKRRGRDAVLSLPARSLALSLLLLALVPSKWPWHFGALMGVGAVAVAAEVARLVRDGERSDRFPTRAAVGLILIVAATTWAWSADGEWSPLDLQTASWTEGFGPARSIDLVFVAAVLAIVISLSRRTRRRAWRPGSIPAVAAGAMFAVVGVTTAILVRDAVISPWSPARQNLQALTGRASCGLAHQLHGRNGLVDELSDRQVRTLLAPSLAMYLPCATIPTVHGGVVEVPRLVAFETRPWPLTEHDGPFAAVSDLYRPRRVAHWSRDVGVLAVTDSIPGRVRVDAEQVG